MLDRVLRSTASVPHATRRPSRARWAATTLAAAVLVAQIVPASAEQPRRGGTLVFSATGEPDTFDCHATPSVASQHRLAPHYSLLVKVDPANYPKIAPDVAESWSIAGDGQAVTFKLRSDVKFHDGSSLTSADVKATFDRIRNPPAGVISLRRGLFSRVADIETPDAATVVFRLREPDAAFLYKVASPWNCLYSARLLAADPDYPSKKVMGTGPFRFSKHVAGSLWEGVRFDDYFMKGLPYLDGLRVLNLRGAGLLNALAGGQTMADFRGITPVQRDRLPAGKFRIYEGPHSASILLVFNTTKKPFDDVRVRRALALAIDRKSGAEVLGRQSIFAFVGGLLPPGSSYARSDKELEPFPGFGPDSEANRAEAKRLLAEAGVPDLKFSLTNANRPDYVALGVFLIDQWRRIGVTVEHKQVTPPAFFTALKQGNFEVMFDSVNEYVDDPVFMLAHFLSFDVAPANSSRMIDRDLDGMFAKIARTADAAERRAVTRAFEARLLNQAYYTPLFWARRMIPIAKEVQGFALTPSYYLGQDLLTLWIRP